MRSILMAVRKILGALAVIVLPVVVMISGPAPAFATGPMTFRLAPTGDLSRCGDRCQKVIVAKGEIVRDTPAVFSEFVRQNLHDSTVRAVILMHSPGGLVVSSMELGRLFRQLGAAVVVARIRNAPDGRGRTTFVSAKCYSACVYALMGASKRVIPPQSRLVVHRMYMYEMLGDLDGQPPRRQKTYRNPRLFADLTRYAEQMGVSSAVIRVAEATPPDTVREISQREIRAWRLGAPRF